MSFHPFPSASRLACLAITAITAAAVLHAPAALAFSDKPVKLIVPAPAGGTIDMIARVVGDQLSRDIGQPVVVENKPGVGGAIAAKYMLSQPADGQTLLMIASRRADGGSARAQRRLRSAA